MGVVVIWLAGSYLTKPVTAKFEAPPSNVDEVSFTSESGSLIQGWLFTVREPVAQAVLMHGVRSSRAQMIDRAKHLQQLGIQSLVFDFQAHGESPGDIITLGYLESFDAQAAVTYMSDAMPELPMLVIAVSMGGAAAILAEPNLDVDAFIVESVYPDIEAAISNRLKSRLPSGHLLTPLLTLQIEPRIGIPLTRLAPASYATNITAPVLVLSGAKDKHTTVTDTQRLFASFTGPKALHLFKDAGHDDLEYFDTQQYWQVVEPFIARYILGGQGSR